MNTKNNERGSALMVVLLLVVVFTLLGMGLLSMNISAAKQFNLKEEQVQARHKAEMGVLHFKKKLNKMLIDHNVALKASNAKLKVELNKDFCNQLLSMKIPLSSMNYLVENVRRTDCNVPGDMTITIDSKGWAGKDNKTKSKIVAELTITIPNNTPSVGGSPPNAPDSSEIATTWPTSCKEIKKVTVCDPVENYTKIDTAVVLKKEGETIFNDHLVLKSLKIKGGNGDSITVAKDFYVEEFVTIQNQTCIVVQNNFTVKNNLSIDSNGHVYIIVYGNAYLPSLPKKGAIYVKGDLFVNGVKQSKSEYHSLNGNEKTIGKCSLPGQGNSSETSVNDWVLVNKIKADYY